MFLLRNIPIKPGWLEPLISPIAKNYKIVTEPLIDGINANTFEFENLNRRSKVGAFNWQLEWKEIPLKQSHDGIRPYTTMIMCGGIFAISRKWFVELNYYDDQLEIWGAENFDLSFKIWMCGGNLVRVPCSRVAHLFRLKGWRATDNMGAASSRMLTTLHNNKRVVETWFSKPYKDYYLEANENARDINTGDKSSVLELRNQCHTFDWFMQNIAYNMTLYFPPVALDNIAYGKIMNDGNRYCITHNEKTRFIKFADCADVTDRWKLSWHEDIQQEIGKLWSLNSEFHISSDAH